MCDYFSLQPVTEALLLMTVLGDVLHWLPIRQWILFKVAVVASDCVSGTGPAYFKEVCMSVTSLIG